VATSTREKLLKTIGLSQKLFSRAQYDAAKRRLRERESDGSVGDELVAIGAISREQLKGLDRAISYRIGREEDKQVGRVIVDSGYADQAAVDRAMQKQKGHYAKTGAHLPVGELLVAEGRITSAQLKAALKIHAIEKGKSGDPRTDSGPPEVHDVDAG